MSPQHAGQQQPREATEQTANLTNGIGAGTAIANEHEHVSETKWKTKADKTEHAR